MATQKQGSAVEVEVRIAAKPETIFAYFTDPKKMVKWKGVTAELEPKPNGLYRVVVLPENIAVGKYVEITPYSKVVFTWGWEGSALAPGSTTVEITLTAAGRETIVRLRHYGLPESLGGQHREGWDHYLARLAIAASGGDPGPDPWLNRPAAPSSHGKE